MIQNNVQKFISVKCTYIFIKEGGVLSWLKYNLHTIKFTHLKYTIQWFYIFRIVQPSPLSNYKTFLSLQKEIPYPLAATPFPTPSPSLWPPPVCFLTMDLSILDFPYMWNYEVYVLLISVQFSRSVVSDSMTPWIAVHQASLSITNSRSLFKLMSIKSMMLSNHLIILCRPLLLLPSIFPSIRVFSSESALRIRRPK